ncbi:MAG TPA: RagB/SusD family nutrient uptake outer membrane protein, partial [Puia sp.]|nr:RagB/SusD family nutrient uptake outer membrane protein [Puia sp.]
NRDTSFKMGYTDTGVTLLNDIITERRKELAFEGHRYWDFARLNQTVQRDNSTGNYLPNVPDSLPASSTKRIFPIPQAELNANKNMVQNPGY